MMDILLLVTLCLISSVGGHARLVQPPSRASMWRYGFNTPRDYGDTEGYCGGMTVQWQVNGGRCGLCGDAWDGPRDHEVGGKYFTGQTVNTYSPGQLLEVSVEVTANHGGHFTFSVCPGGPEEDQDPSQQCLDNNLLTVLQTRSTSYPLPDRRTGLHNLTLQLPKALTCSRCVLQWTWTCSNNWGLCGSSGRGAMGCGPQETFRACSDIAILTKQNGHQEGHQHQQHFQDQHQHQLQDQLQHQQNRKRIFKGKRVVVKGSGMAVRTKLVESDRLKESFCVGAGLYRGSQGMDGWCMANCNHSPRYCPPSHCHCTSSSTYLLPNYPTG